MRLCVDNKESVAPITWSPPPPTQGRRVVKRPATRAETGVHQGRAQNNIAALTVPKSTLGSITVKCRTIETVRGLQSQRCELSEENEKEKYQNLNGPSVLHFLYADGNMFHKCNVTAAFQQSRCATLMASYSRRLGVVIAATGNLFLIQGH